MASIMNETVVDARTASTGTKWWRQIDDAESVVMAVSNGSTNFGVVKGGTPLGEITSSGKYRPCGKGVLTATLTTSTTVTVGTEDILLFRNGDTVDLIQASDGSTIDSALTVSAIDTAAGTLTISASNSAAIGDYIQTTDGSATAVGILKESICTNTNSLDADGVAVHRDQGGVMATRGVAISSELVADNAQIVSDLTGHFTFR